MYENNFIEFIIAFFVDLTNFYFTYYFVRIKIYDFIRKFEK